MGQLRTCDLDLQIGTPMMTGGVDHVPEVRAPSMRGQLRLWLRALFGGIWGDDPARVRVGESAVLGQASRASPVAVRAIGDPTRGRLPPDPRSFPGVQYMFWSAYQGRRGFLLPGQGFHLRLQTRPFDVSPVDVEGQIIDRDRAFELALAALWLVVQLGNMGFRARRGAGGLRVEDTPAGWPDALPPLQVRARTPGELADGLAQDLGRLRRFGGWEPVEHVTAPTSFNVLHPDAFTLQVLDRPFPSWWEALDVVGQTFRAFRQRQPEDYQLIKGILTQGRTALVTVKRAIFGLPLPFFFSSLSKDLANQGVPSHEARARASATVMPRGGDRRGSPLFFRVVQLAGDEPASCLVLGLWRSRLTTDDRLVVRPRDRALRPVTLAAPTDFSYVDEWFSYLGQQVGPLLPVAYT